MTTFNALTQRVRSLLQDVPDAGAPLVWEDAQIRTALNTALLDLHRWHTCQDLLWVHAVQGQRDYPLNAQSLVLLAGTDTSGTTGNLTTLTDSIQTFTASVLVGDRVRNLTDGSVGVITTVAATVLTCATGFTGGVDNAADTRDAYVVERPLSHTTVLGVLAVLYDGVELEYATRDRLDRLSPGWELRQDRPRYWTVDQADTPTVMTLTPAPLVTGSSVPQFPMAPVAQRLEQNLVLVIAHHPQTSLDGLEDIHTLDVYHTPMVYAATARLAGFEGEWQHLSLATSTQALARLWLTRLGVPHG